MSQWRTGSDHGRPKKPRYAPASGSRYLQDDEELSPRRGRAAPYSDWTKRIPVVGLRNLGNTCFFNSAMQGLHQTYELHEQLVCARTQGGPLEVKPKFREPIEITLKPNTSGNSMASAMYSVFSEMRSSSRYGADPGPVHEVLSNHESKYRSRRQEDSAEALRYILAIMRQDELKRIENAIDEQLQDKPEKRRDVLRKAYMKSVSRSIWDYTLVDKVFGGELLIKTTCCLETCKHEKKSFEPFSDLSVALGIKQQQEKQAPMSGGSEAPPPSLAKQSVTKEKSQVEEEGCCTWCWHILCCCLYGQRSDQQPPEEESESQANSIAQYSNSPGEKRRKSPHILQVSQDHEAELKSPEDSRLAFASEINVTHGFQSSRTLTAPSDQMLGESEVIEECQQWTGKDARSYQGMSSVPAVETGAHDKSGTVAAAEAATVAEARTEAEAAADSHDSEEPKPTEGEKAKPNTVMPKSLTTPKEHGTKTTASPTLGACASEICAQSIIVGLSPQASGENSLEFTGYAQTAGKDKSESEVMASGRGRTKSNIDTSDHSQNDGNSSISSQDPSPKAGEQLGASAGLKSWSINQQQGVLSTESAAPPQILTHSVTIPIELQASTQEAPVLASLELTAAAHSDQVNDSDMVTPTGSPVPDASKYLFPHPSPNASLSGKEDSDSDQTPHVSGDELSETEGHGTSDSRSISCRSQEHATTLSLDPTPKPTLDAASTVEDAGIGDTSGMLSQQETHILAKLLSVRPFNALLIGHEEPQQDLELPGVLSTADKVPTEIDTAASLIAAERAAAPRPTSAKGKGESGETSKDARETSISERTPPTVDEQAKVIPADINHALLKKISESDLKSKSSSWPTFASSSQDRIPAPYLPGAKSSPNLIYIGKRYAANEDSSLRMSRWHSMPALHSVSGEWSQVLKNVPSKSWPNVEKATRVDTAVQDNSPFPVPNRTKEQGEEVSKDCSSDTIPSAHPPYHNGNRSDDSTDLLEGGGKKSKPWVLQPSPKQSIDPTPKLTLDAASTVEDAGIGDTPGMFSQQETHIMAKLLSVRPYNALLIGDEKPQQDLELPGVLSTAGKVPTEIDTAASLIAAERAAAPHPTSAKGKGESGETSKDAQETRISERTPPTVDKLAKVIPADINHATSTNTIPSAHPPDHNGNRSDDSTDLLEGGGKKSKPWVLEPSPKPVDKHSKRLNIGDCLGLFTAEELIQGEHSLCERCAEVQRMHEINSQDQGDNRATPVGGDTRRQVKINRLPQVLIVNLKRFEVVGRRLQKRHDPVDTTPELDVAPFCTEECIEKCSDVDEDGKIWYTPFALTSHSGSLHGGHYVAYVKSRSYDGTSDGEHLKKEHLLAGHRQVGSQDGWYYVSDSHVGESDESSALTAQAYTVFYERKRIPGDAAHARA